MRSFFCCSSLNVSFAWIFSSRAASCALAVLLWKAWGFPSQHLRKDFEFRELTKFSILTSKSCEYSAMLFQMHMLSFVTTLFWIFLNFATSLLCKKACLKIERTIRHKLYSLLDNNMRKTNYILMFREYSLWYTVATHLRARALSKSQVIFSKGHSKQT